MTKFAQFTRLADTPVRKDLINFKTFLMSLAVMLGVAYVWQINSLSTYGYQIRALENQAATLKKDNKDLENKMVNLRSMVHLEDKIEKLAMESAAKVEYLNPVTNQIAQK
ncbi:hypothetical protein HY224_02145 [Candidatus Uhrbacteria bacterium]|nr:hypothetical protein [Candidatus Uhrbacteria bacterium]